MSVAHIRRRGPRWSPHRPGRITPENVLAADPRRRTLCGAEPTDRDYSFRAGVRTLALDLCIECAEAALRLELES